jgi:predicted mannosyl-3-phosphoglycerate phosphatase (HAD superfamily)
MMAFLLIGCSSEEEKAAESFKESTTAADFVKLNEDPEVKKRINFTGEVTFVDGGEFTVTTDEGNGKGIYSVVMDSNYPLYEAEKGDNVKVYGVVDGKNDSNMIMVTARYVEEK